MAREIPGSGAVIEPIFNDIFGVRSVIVKEGGSGYISSDPPRLTVSGCGTPDEEALLYPIIDDDSGRIVHVRVLESGRGYDPLRINFIPQQDTNTIAPSFDIKRIWQSHPNSETTADFTVINGDVTDRLRIQSDNNLKPSYLASEVTYANKVLVDQTFDRTFIYRGSKDVPNPGLRLKQTNKSFGILANGGLLHTPDWGSTGNAPVNFNIDVVKHPYLKNMDSHDGVIDNGVYYYHTSEFLSAWRRKNDVLDTGFEEVFTWRVKTELDNILIGVSNIIQNLGDVEVGRTVDVLNGSTSAQIAKIITDQQGVITKVYLRQVTGSPLEVGDVLVGSTGFRMTVSDDPILFPNGIFYIDFGPEAHEFGDFIPNTYYLSPQNIQVQRNYLIIWDQSDPSNIGHPMQFSTTPDGTLNPTPGTLYYNSTGASNAPAADYEQLYQPLFLMHGDETNRIYYYCQHHQYMSGYTGDEGYMILDPQIEQEEMENDYYIYNFFTNSNGDPEYDRHPDGHSKILGLSFDGYPIYGPYGYDDNGSVINVRSSFRFKQGVETDGNRPQINTVETVNYTVTTVNGEYHIDGSKPSFLSLGRGKTYVFNLTDASNAGAPFYFSETSDGTHASGTIFDSGVQYFIDGAQVTESVYAAQFATATSREVRFAPKVDAPNLLYTFSTTASLYGFRCVQEGYVLGDLIQDYIYDTTVGDLDEYNGRFAVTPEYPNGTYAYFMCIDDNGDPEYPYAIGPEMYGIPYFQNSEVPAVVNDFAAGAEGKVVLDNQGRVSYINMINTGDGYFGATRAEILGGEGSGATTNPGTQSVTSLVLLNEGTQFATPPTLIFEGGGGEGARGRARVDTTGKVTRVSMIDEGDFYLEPPYVLFTGGGGEGAKGVPIIDQGKVTGIEITDPGQGYTSPPNVIFTKLVNLKRKVNSRQSFNSEAYYQTGLVKALTSNDDEIFVRSTNGFPGSGDLVINNESVFYTGKTFNSFTGVTRGTTFKYDQRVVLDLSQNDQDGISQYEFNVGDRVIRRVENSNNKIAKVYDWNPNNRELLVTFEVDELAFIDGGIPSTEDATVQFDAGIASSSGQEQPHVLVAETGSTIALLTNPLSTLVDFKFEDDDEGENNEGDGIPDLVNTNTDYLNQINLDGGIYSSLYGIEETFGGQNTTLFQVGDQVKDAAIPVKFATIIEAGALSEGVPHEALIEITLDTDGGNGLNYSTGELITGEESGITARVVSWFSSTGILTVNQLTPYFTGDVNLGNGGYLYNFSVDSTIVDFIVQDPGINYSATPTIAIEAIGDVPAVVTANMTTAGDQIASVTVTDGGYGYPGEVTLGVYHPTATVTPAVGDTTGTGAVVQAILGGERILGNAGAAYRIKSVKSTTLIRTTDNY